MQREALRLPARHDRPLDIRRQERQLDKLALVGIGDPAAFGHRAPAGQRRESVLPQDVMRPAQRPDQGPIGPGARPACASSVAKSMA